MIRPGPLRTIRLLARLLLRRLANRVGTRWRRKKPAADSLRTATPRKGRVGWIGAAFIALIMGFNGLNLGSALLRNIKDAIGPPEDAEGRIELSSYGYAWLQRHDKWHSYDDNFHAQEDLRQGFVTELRNAPLKNRDAHVAAMVRQYHERGLDGFTDKRHHPVANFMPRLGAWNSTDGALQLSKTIGGILLLFFLTWLFLDFGTANQDLGKVDWTMEWLFTMPVSSAGLFAAQLLGFAVTEPLMWCGAWPVMITVFVSADWGWWSVLLGAAVALYLSVLVASLRVVGETALHCSLAPPRLKNLQALFSVLGTCGLFLLVANIGDNAVSTTCVAWASRIPDAATWLPVVLPGTLPAFNTIGDVRNIVVAVMLASVIIVPCLAVAISAWLVRGGLLTVSGAYTGKRIVAGETAAAVRPPALLRGVTGKDLRLLLRDRNFLVQTLVVPVMVIGFQLVLHGGMIDAVRTQFQQAAVLAFAVGAYVLIATAMSALSVEGNSLWMLYTFPRDIAAILRRKTRLWAAVALVYTMIVLALCAWTNPHLKAGDAVFALLACAGVLVYAFIASGIGILATDPLETEVRRRVRPAMVQMYMILAAMYAHALYATSGWTRLVQLVLSILLSFALWQKVRDRVPFLLDPMAAAPPSVSLSDGLIAALTFFVLQGILQIAFIGGGIAPGVALFVAFVIAGACVVALSFYVFWRAGMPGVLTSVGLQTSAGRKGIRKALGLGVIGGLGAGAFGAGYLRAVDWVPALHDLKVQTLKLPFDPGIWLLVIAIGAAPIFEEFIFRGLVFRGLLRSTNAVLAIFGSAAIFAIVHPPISVVPVFVLGAVAAWTVYRSGQLISAITTHMIYNAVVVAMNWYIR